jgi:hypothetical protein
MLNTLRRAGLIYIRIEHYGTKPAEDVFEEESLGNSITKEDVVAKLSQDIYPIQLLQEYLGKRLDDLLGCSVRDVDRDYRTILGFPVPTHTNSVFKAIRALCKEGRIGVRHPRGDFSGQDPELTESELSSATLDAPFEKHPPIQPPTPIVGPGPQPPGPRPQPPGPIFPPSPPRGELCEIGIPPQQSPGALRQQVAVNLQPFGEVTVSKVRFTIFFESTSGDLSTLPQSLRGSLSGAGSLTTEITITQKEVGGKGEVEQLVERLPHFTGASYSARLEILKTVPVEEETEHV